MVAEDPLRCVVRGAAEMLAPSLSFAVACWHVQVR